MADKCIKTRLKKIIKMICKWKGYPIHAWRIGDEHALLFLTVPPKYPVSYVVAIIEGKSSAWIKKQTKVFPKGTLWNRGYFISTVGVNELAVEKYVENQRHEQKWLASLKLPF